jgi:hypothetical protein
MANRSLLSLTSVLLSQQQHAQIFDMLAPRAYTPIRVNPDNSHIKYIAELKPALK